MTTSKASILIVEDEAKMRRLLELNLADDGFETMSAGDAETGLKLLQNGPVDLVLTDLKLPGMNGLDFLAAVKRFQAALPVVVMTAFGTVETAVEAMKAGASDYVLKPFSLDEMRMVVHKELDVHRLRVENRSLREALQQRYQHPNVVARSVKMQEVLATVERVAPTNSTVLLGGESGVGKDLVARAIHEKSRRASGPFIKINSTAIPENLLESELFGYEKGAFTGATTSKPGKFELADKGTLFLDEIGDVPSRDAGEAAARFTRARVRTAGRHPHHQSRCAAGGRDQPGLACSARRGHLPRRFVLPPERGSYRHSSIARAQGRHSRPGEPFRLPPGR
jgi:two-component system, NtrC family, response regulator